MPKDSPHNRQMRSRIAHLAARLMAEDGVDDFGLAKRKAARQAGAPDTRNLPDNAEVEAALRDYQQLYQADEQASRLRALRERALDAMTLLTRFNPHLVGPVMTGSANRYAEIDLHLFADNPKDVELFLLNRGIDFRAKESRFFIAGEPKTVPAYEFQMGDDGVRVAVFETDDIRGTIRAHGDGRPIERARREWLERTLASSPGTLG